MSRKPAQRAGLTEHEDLINALVAEIKSARHGEHEKLVMTIRNLSRTPKGVEMLYQARTIPELVALLGHKNDKYVSYALDTLHSLIRHKGNRVDLRLNYLTWFLALTLGWTRRKAPAKQQVRLCGGVEKMVDLMPRSENQLAHLQSVLFDCLSCLAYHSIETKGIILSMGGTNQLLKIVSGYAKNTNGINDKKLTTATKLLKVLSVDDQNKAQGLLNIVYKV